MTTYRIHLATCALMAVLAFGLGELASVLMTDWNEQYLDMRGPE